MRCKACDVEFKPVWSIRRHTFEDLCPSCLGPAYEAARDTQNYRELVPENYRWPNVKRIMPDD